MRSIIFLVALCLLGQQPNVPNPALAPIQDRPGLPRVLLIGDSISIGYTEPVRDLLNGIANVHRIPANGGPTVNGLAHIDEWLGNSKWDVIHFNWGLHDLKRMDHGGQQVPVAEYERNLATLVERLRKTDAVLIWAATTPVPEGKVSPPRMPADVMSYNEAAARVMGKRGVVINDLYAFVLPRMQALQIPVNVHFTKEGSRVLAEQVAGAIRRALRR